MSQGFGFGRRAAGTREDQHFMSGGIGVLRDLFGNDTYRADVFAQGGGYWFGTGVLADAGGDDVYDGEWYTQGAAAHFALGVLLDDAGNDDHNPHGRWMNVEAGGGHDFSVGILVDGAGNDRYKVPGLSLGAGNANGIGLFVDRTGDDAYESQSGASLGWASLSGEVRGQAPRRARPTFGLFLDGGGADTYVHPDAGGVGIGNGRLWTRAADSDEEVRHNEHGVGLDGEGPIRLGP